MAEKVEVSEATLHAASGSIPALCLEESPMNLRFTASCELIECSMNEKNIFLSQYAATLGALSTSVTSLKILPC